MTVLSYQTIKQLGEQTSPLIAPFLLAQCRPASYDLTVGDEYYIYDKEHKDRVVIQPIKKNGQFVIPQNTVCYVLTNELVNMPENIVGSLSLRMGLMKQGIMMPHQSPVDPGYTGKLVATLYNLSNERVIVTQGEHLMSIEFRTLDYETVRPYSDTYQALKSLDQFLSLPVNSSLNGMRADIEDLKEDMQTWAHKITSYLPNIMLIISIVVAILVAIQSVKLFDPRGDNCVSDVSTIEGCVNHYKEPRREDNAENIGKLPTLPLQKTKQKTN